MSLPSWMMPAKKGGGGTDDDDDKKKNPSSERTLARSNSSFEDDTEIDRLDDHADADVPSSVVGEYDGNDADDNERGGLIAGAGAGGGGGGEPMMGVDEDPLYNTAFAASSSPRWGGGGDGGGDSRATTPAPMNRRASGTSGMGDIEEPDGAFAMNPGHGDNSDTEDDSLAKSLIHIAEEQQRQDELRQRWSSARRSSRAKSWCKVGCGLALASTAGIGLAIILAAAHGQSDWSMTWCEKWNICGSGSGNAAATTTTTKGGDNNRAGGVPPQHMSSSSSPVLPQEDLPTICDVTYVKSSGEGYEECLSACLFGSCCFASAEGDNCSTNHPDICGRYQPCHLIFGTTGGVLYGTVGGAVDSGDDDNDEGQGGSSIPQGAIMFDPSSPSTTTTTTTYIPPAPPMDLDTVCSPSNRLQTPQGQTQCDQMCQPAECCRATTSGENCSLLPNANKVCQSYLRHCWQEGYVQQQAFDRADGITPLSSSSFKDQVENACSTESLSTDIGSKHCFELCNQRLCCYRHRDGTPYGGVEGMDAAVTNAECPPPGEDGDVGGGYCEAVVKCKSLYEDSGSISEDSADFVWDGGKGGKNDEEEEDDNIRLKKRVEDVCSSDKMDDMDAMDECEELCYDRECCFSSTCPGGVSVAWCDVVEICRTLFHGGGGGEGGRIVSSSSPRSATEEEEEDERPPDV